MDNWLQVLTLIGATFLQILTLIGATFWITWTFRKESREDWHRTQNIIDAIRIEMKDFHERLLEIELDKKN